MGYQVGRMAIWYCKNEVTESNREELGIELVRTRILFIGVMTEGRYQWDHLNGGMDIASHSYILLVYKKTVASFWPVPILQQMVQQLTHAHATHF